MVRPEDVRGELLVFEDALEGSVEAARRQGLSYLGVVTETTSAAAVRALRERVTGERLVRWVGIVVPVDAEGGLAVPRGIEPDFVVARVTHAPGSAEAQTARLLRAIRHPKVRFLLHPTARRIGERPPLAFEVEAVLDALAAHGVALCLSGDLTRLDPAPEIVRVAMEREVPMLLTAEPRAPGDLHRLEYAVRAAQRGWGLRSRVLNARPPGAISRWLRG